MFRPHRRNFLWSNDFGVASQVKDCPLADTCSALSTGQSHDQLSGSGQAIGRPVTDKIRRVVPSSYLTRTCDFGPIFVVIGARYLHSLAGADRPARTCAPQVRIQAPGERPTAGRMRTQLANKLPQVPLHHEKSTMPQRIILSLLVVCVLTTVTQVRAASIGMNFTCDGGFCDEPNDLLPGEVAGLVPQANWNNANGPYSGTEADIFGPLSGLLADDAGVNSGASLTWIGGDGDPGTGTSIATPDGKLFQGIIQGHALSSIPIEVTVDNVPYAQYDVYVYVGEFFNTTSSARIGDQTFYYDATSNFDTDGYVQATATTIAGASLASYVLFEGLTDNSFTLELIRRTGSRTGISGFQIVETAAVPEPSTYAMAAIGLVGMFAYRLRRRR